MCLGDERVAPQPPVLRGERRRPGGPGAEDGDQRRGQARAHEERDEQHEAEQDRERQRDLVDE